MNKLKIDYLVHGIVVSDIIETADSAEQVLDQLSFKLGNNYNTTDITNSEGGVLSIKNSSIDGIAVSLFAAEN